MKEVLDVLPWVFRESGRTLLEKFSVEEFRLRQGQKMSYILGREEIFAETPRVTKEDIAFLLARACDFSIHAVQEQIARGFLTISGGHRVGICGSAVMEQGKIQTIRDISSISIRISREYKGISKEILPQLMGEGEFSNTLLLAPPGKGKTTLLRDLIYHISQEQTCGSSRIAVVDERSEIAGTQNGVHHFDLGSTTDVMDGCPKNLAMVFLLRSMNPDILAVDEITALEDVEGLIQVVGCGVKLLATAHGAEKKDLFRRDIYRKLIEYQIFQRLVTIKIEEGRRRYCVEVL